jgi:hypothetical protein
MAALLHPALLPLPRGEAARDISCGPAASLVLLSSGRLLLLGPGPGKAHSQALAQVVAPCLAPGLAPVAALLAGPGLAATLGPLHPATSALLQAEQALLRGTRAVTALLQTVSPRGGEQGPLAGVRDQSLALHSLLTYLASLSALDCCSLASAPRLGSLAHLSHLTAALDALQMAVCDCISMDCLLLDSGQQHAAPVIVEALASQFHVPGERVRGQAALEQLLTEHARSVSGLLAAVMAASVAGCGELERHSGRLAGVVRAQERRWAEAEGTREFWRSLPRLASLRTPGRRLLLDSRLQPVSLGGHFSKHWLLLLSDTLVDVGYSYTAAAHPLATVWLEAAPAPRLELTLTLPEDCLTLLAPDPAGRRAWQRALAQAILATLGKPPTGPDGGNMPPDARHASYTFTKGALRGARYEGAWLGGKPHGKGRMDWPDGGWHEGAWRGGERHGRGRHTGPRGAVQEGVWARGRLEGRGRLVEEGAQYEGGLEEGRPHGHGVRREGRFLDRGASLYVGDWVKGVRQVGS